MNYNKTFYVMDIWKRHLILNPSDYKISLRSKS